MIKLLTDIANNMYNAFNVVIPGLNISISDIFLGCLFLTILIGFIKLRVGDKQ